MCVKLLSGDLNLDSYPHTPQTFILMKCTTPRVHGGNNNLILTILVKIKKKKMILQSAIKIIYKRDGKRRMKLCIQITR